MLLAPLSAIQKGINYVPWAFVAPFKNITIIGEHVQFGVVIVKVYKNCDYAIIKATILSSFKMLFYV